MPTSMLALLRSNSFLAVVLVAIALPSGLVYALRVLMHQRHPAALRVGAFFQEYGRLIFSVAFLIHAFGIFLSLGPWVRLLTALCALCACALWMGSGGAPSRPMSPKGRSPYFSTGG
jgi:hypothetical protein